MAEHTMPFAQYAEQAQEGAKRLAEWHARLPPHEDVEDSCIFELSSQPGLVILPLYDCTDKGCPGSTESGMARCSCRTNCGAPGCRGYTLEEDMPWRGGGEEPGE